MLCFSVANLGITADVLVDAARNADTCIFGLTLCSVVVIMEFTIGLGRPNLWIKYRNIAYYATAMSIVSVLLGLVTFGWRLCRLVRGTEPATTSTTPPTPNEILMLEARYWSLIVLVLLWIVAACLTTFIGPFLITGNGYFAVWAAPFFSGLTFLSVQKDVLNALQKLEDASRRRQQQQHQSILQQYLNPKTGDMV